MSMLFKRPGASDAAKDAADKEFVLLTTAQNNAEQALIESILRSEQIPYIIRPHSRESWSRVMLGFDIGGNDFFVPEDMMLTASELIAKPEEDNTEQSE